MPSDIWGILLCTVSFETGNGLQLCSVGPILSRTIILYQINYLNSGWYDTIFCNRVRVLLILRCGRSSTMPREIFRSERLFSAPPSSVFAIFPGFFVRKPRLSGRLAVRWRRNVVDFINVNSRSVAHEATLSVALGTTSRSHRQFFGLHPCNLPFCITRKLRINLFILSIIVALCVFPASRLWRGPCTLAWFKVP